MSESRNASLKDLKAEFKELLLERPWAIGITSEQLIDFVLDKLFYLSYSVGKKQPLHLTNKMSNIERVEPIQNNGVELYVSDIGESGCSQVGLARLCGVGENTLRRVLSDRNKMAFILGKDIPSADLYLAVSSNQQAKIIKSEYCAKIISYYAFKAKHKNETAQFSLEKFVDIGIDTWIKDTVGFVEKFGTTESKLFDLLAIMGQDIKEMKADLASTSGYRAASITLPGLREWMESLDESAQEQLALPCSESEELFTLNEWASISQNGLILSKSNKHALALLVSSTYKTMALEMPSKVCRYNDKGYKLAPVQAYPACHFTLINMCFSKLILTNN